jgi:ABC-type amino acid transport substrate-binding protein
MMQRFAAIAVAALLVASPVLAQDKQPPLKTGVDGTFAPHAMPKLGGGIEGFQIDLFTEAARRMKREIVFDAVSFSTLIPGMQSGRYDFIAAPTTVTKERAENMLFTAGYLWTAFQFGIKPEKLSHEYRGPVRRWTTTILYSPRASLIHSGAPLCSISTASKRHAGVADCCER